jgi:hypothetical protein
MLPKFSNKPQIDRNSSFNQPPPGHSLTDTPGKWAWERPTEFTGPSEAMDALLDSIQKPEVEESMIQLMASGVSIEEICNTMTKLGFMEGKFTADVAEILKPNLGVYLMGLAVEAGIDNVTKVVATMDGIPRTNYGMDDMQLLKIMKDRNPDLHKQITNEMPRREQAQAMRQRQLQKESFLGMPEPPERSQADMMEDMMEGPEENGEMES